MSALSMSKIDYAIAKLNELGLGANGVAEADAIDIIAFDARAEYEALRDKLDALKHYADVDRERIATLQSSIKELEAENKALRAENRRLKSDLCQPYVWADEATPFTGKEVMDLLNKNEAMKKVVDVAREWREKHWSNRGGDTYKTCLCPSCTLERAIEAYEQESA
jgi:regulator of replication initiation timing